MQVACGTSGPAAADREIPLGGTSIFKTPPQLHASLAMPGEEEHARRVAIEPVDGLERAHALAELLDHAQRIQRIPRWHTRDPRRLVHPNHPAISMQHLQGGLPLTEMLSLAPHERALALCRLTSEGPGLALGTRQGVVKRVNPEVLGRDDWEVIGLKDGDEVAVIPPVAGG